ncbi:hypothetical protein [Accumulibacter sp.]
MEFAEAGQLSRQSATAARAGKSITLHGRCDACRQPIGTGFRQ